MSLKVAVRSSNSLLQTHAHRQLAAQVGQPRPHLWTKPIGRRPADPVPLRLLFFRRFRRRLGRSSEQVGELNANTFEMLRAARDFRPLCMQFLQHSAAKVLAAGRPFQAGKATY